MLLNQPQKNFDEIKKNIEQLIHNPDLIKKLETSELSDICLFASQSYRAGSAVVEDDFYDHFLIAELSKRNPNHPLISEIEDDYQNFGIQKIDLPEPMLSTQKAYEVKQIELFLERIHKQSMQMKIDFESLEFKVMVKLDGFAAYFDGNKLITRGNGVRGTDISRALYRGLLIFDNPNCSQNLTGAGEIVVKKSYFKKHLVNDFIHPRNFVASVIKEKELDEKTQKAVSEKATLFIPFSQLDAHYLKASQLINSLNQIYQNLSQEIDFEFDGLVIELSDKNDIQKQLRNELGSTIHHHRWQIAYKKNTEIAKSTILEMTPQTGRTGKITPVATISPVKLSGATIHRVSAHNYDLVNKLQIGKDAKVEIVRSGEVIPKITAILKPSSQVDLPELCPSCNSKLIWQTKFLICSNHLFCPEQIMGNLTYFFKSLDNLDGFGPATIKTFYKFGIRKVSEIYKLSDDELKKMGYKTKTRSNLLNALSQSCQSQLEDWRFLTAFGIERLGQAASMKLLENFSLEQIFDLKIDDLIKLDGFAEITAKAMLEGIEIKKDEIKTLLPLFNLKHLQKSAPDLQNLILKDIKICFTGKMSKDRNQMQNQARELGAKVVDGISGNTDWLVVGENAGASKLQKAEKLKLKILTQSEYFDLIIKR